MNPAKKFTLILSQPEVIWGGGGMKGGWGYLLVDIGSAEWNLCPDRASEANNIDQDAGDIRDIRAKVDPGGVVVWTTL